MTHIWKSWLRKFQWKKRREQDCEKTVFCIHIVEYGRVRSLKLNLFHCGRLLSFIWILIQKTCQPQFRHKQPSLTFRWKWHRAEQNMKPAFIPPDTHTHTVRHRWCIYVNLWKQPHSTADAHTPTPAHTMQFTTQKLTVGTWTANRKISKHCGK